VINFTGLFFKAIIMAEKKAKEVKEYVVNVKSVGTAINWKGKPTILNNGLPQSTLKALHAHGLKCITKNSK
jgi:hypothetical protein